jgi:hypothetical protein
MIGLRLLDELVSYFSVVLASSSCFLSAYSICEGGSSGADSVAQTTTGLLIIFWLSAGSDDVFESKF